VLKIPPLAIPLTLGVIQSAFMNWKVILSFIFTFFIISCVQIAPKAHDLKYQEKEFTELANFILDQNSIYEMDDFTRYYKKINGISVKLKNREGDQYAQFLHVVEDSLKLDSIVVSYLRNKLEETQLRDFTKSGDTILFTVDGFLDNSWGFMYSKRGLKMDSTWFDFKGNSIKFVEDVDANWKRTVIR
jgi:hypothetical protein